MLSPYIRLAATAAATFAATAALCQSSTTARHDCLFASTVEGNAVPSCDNSDSLSIGKDKNVTLAMAALGIDSKKVRFVSCKGEKFHVMPDQLVDGLQTYIIYYPPDARKAFLAPTIHELAHVMQMEAAGDSRALHASFNHEASKHIELGADFMTGVLFKKLFPATQTREFEQNTILFGQYVEDTKNAHGKQSERNAAFLRGFNANLETLGDTARKIHETFQRKIYGQITFFSSTHETHQDSAR